MYKPCDIIVEVDLETLGLENDAVVFAIGAAAVVIGSNGDPCSTFKQVILIEGQEELGRKIEPATVNFWAKQNDEARRDLIASESGHGAPLRESMQQFTGWFAGLPEFLPPGGQIYIIGKDPSFDIAKMKSLYQCAGLQAPWFFRNVRCQRTIETMGEMAGLPMAWEVDDRQGELHDALSDAVYQTRRAHRIINGAMAKFRAAS